MSLFLGEIRKLPDGTHGVPGMTAYHRGQFLAYFGPMAPHDAGRGLWLTEGGVIQMETPEQAAKRRKGRNGHDGTWRVVGEDRAEGAIGAMEPFEVVVCAITAEGAKDRVRSLRYQAGRDHVLCKSAVWA